MLTRCFRSSVVRSLRTASSRRPAAARSAFQPLKSNFAPAVSARLASTDSAKHGKIHQVIGAVVDGTERSRGRPQLLEKKLTLFAVKFDTEKLPPILNALETDNGGQKLVLEVAVREIYGPSPGILGLGLTAFNSNIWVKVLSDVLLWTVCIPKRFFSSNDRNTCCRYRGSRPWIRCDRYW